MFEVEKSIGHLTGKWKLLKKFKTEKEAINECIEICGEKYDVEVSAIEKVSYYGEKGRDTWQCRIVDK